MSKRGLCRYFMRGDCLKGDRCDFSHDERNQANNVCKYYQRGNCSFGIQCRYDHVEQSRPLNSTSSSTSFPQSSSTNSVSSSHPGIFASSSATSVPTAPLKLSASSRPFHAQTKEVRRQVPNHRKALGKNTVESRSIEPDLQMDLCSTCGEHCLHPSSLEQREEHIKDCEKKQKLTQTQKLSQEMECSVCFERVLSKPEATERKFGLLLECDHPFCLSCIRKWRNTPASSGIDLNSALRACPICRKTSHFVVPSTVWYFSKEEKEEIIESYKLGLKSIDCKHFDFGNARCPFGIRCFYKHTVKPGSYAWKYSRPPPPRSSSSSRRRMGREESQFFGPEDFDLDHLLLSPDEAEMMLLMMSLGLAVPGSDEDDDDDDDNDDNNDDNGDMDFFGFVNGENEYDPYGDLTPEQLAFFRVQCGYDSDDEIYP